MNVSINGEKKTVKATTVAELLTECGFDADKIAVAINAEFVPRSTYVAHSLSDNDEIDILAAVQGG